MSKEVWSDVRRAAFSTIFNAFALWVSSRDWSVTASLLSLAIAVGLAWNLLTTRSPEQKGSTTRKPGRRPGQPSLNLGSLAKLIAFLVAIGVAVGAGWNGVERVRVQRLARGLTWQAAEAWRATCLGMKIAELTEADYFELDGRFFPTLITDNHNMPMQQMLFQSAMDELTQKGVRENTPIPSIPRSMTTEEIQKLQPSLNPTPLGRSLCAYYLTAYKPPKKPTPSKPQ